MAADEPTVGLDAASRERLNGLVGQHVAKAASCSLATHVDLGIRTGTLDSRRRDPIP